MNTQSKKYPVQNRNVKFAGISILAEDVEVLDSIVATLEAEKGVPVARSRAVGIALRAYAAKRKGGKR